MGYTRESITSECVKAARRMETFYNRKMVNYSGNLSDDVNMPYTEVIAEWLLGEFGYFDGIKMDPRTKSYQAGHHKKECDPKALRQEEHCAFDLHGRNLPCIGKVLDYQVPLKNERDDESGKVDLISLNDNILYLLELKREPQEEGDPKGESLLRCVLEIATYWRIVDRAKLKADFDIAPGVEVRPAALVFKDSRPHREWKNKSSFVRKLMSKLDVDIFILERTADKKGYLVSRP